ncbi:hypothetical protein B566_EDAN004966 [Ephemera danica]|nr:hypothetical protein B566_EDAN004966 [Ephemera danica]
MLESRFRPSLQDLVGLKDAILSKFTEMIERHTRDALQEETEQNQMFGSMLIRRIKRLVQFVPI